MSDASAPPSGSKAGPQPRVSAVIVSYHTGPMLTDCLAAALAAPDVDEIVLVDNGNPPEALAAARDQLGSSTTAQVITGHGNVGFAAACNLGAGAARGEHLLFLNPDAILEPGAVDQLVRTGAALTHQPWIVGGRVLGLDGVEHRGGRRDTLTKWRAIVDFTGLSALEPIAPVFASMHHESQPLPAAPIRVGAVSGAFCLMTARDFFALGGFDERYFLHVEDLDLCRRVYDAGGMAVFDPGAVVRHAGATSAVDSAFVARCKADGLARYFNTFASGPVDRLVARAVSRAARIALMHRARVQARAPHNEK